MTLDLTEAQEALIQRLAEQDGKTPTQVLVETAAWLESMEADEQERRILEERIAEADRGEFLSEEEMHARFLQMLSPR